jgi:hypothetical protein
MVSTLQLLISSTYYTYSHIVIVIIFHIFRPSLGYQMGEKHSRYVKYFVGIHYEWLLLDSLMDV